MVGTGGPESYHLTARDIERIAEAFELPRDRVLSDAVIVFEWQGSEQGLLDHLQHGHNWDGSVSPYYVFWIRSDGGHPPVHS